MTLVGSVFRYKKGYWQLFGPNSVLFIGALFRRIDNCTQEDVTATRRQGLTLRTANLENSTMYVAYMQSLTSPRMPHDIWSQSSLIKSLV